jgi:large subunit ribosomal protein L16
MLQPKRTNYRKAHKGRIHGNAKGGTELNFGAFGLKAMEPERITARQIEAARRAITRQMKRQGRVWIRIFPDVPVTDKPAEVRMGKGKGAVEYWAARVHPGRIMFEIDGVPDDVAREALRLGAAKLPVKTRIVTRIDVAVAEHA